MSFLMIQFLRSSTLFPYTTLFRSGFSGQDASDDRGSVRSSGGVENRTAAGAERSREGPLAIVLRSEEHTSELQSPYDLVCRLLLEKKNRRSFKGRRIAHRRVREFD